MDKNAVIAFFDRLAPGWDADMIRHEDVIAKILDGAGIVPGVSVLDVGCGTGVLIPDYLARNVACVTGADISPEMVRIAREKFPQEHVNFRCGDVVEMTDLGPFDRIMIYNAFPHFPDPEKLIATLSRLLAHGGSLTVAHGMSRAQIDHHHEGAASAVSHGLMHEDDLAAIFARYLSVTVKISDDRMYQVTGVRS